MKKHFSVSLCKNGILGGGLTVDEKGATYRTGKLTVDPKYRNLNMPFADLTAISKGRLLFFPTFTFQMKNGESHQFIVFARKRFRSFLHTLGWNIQ